MRAILAVLFLSIIAPVTLAQEAWSGDPWPEIRTERIATLLPEAMDRAEVDAWLLLCRENNNDPMARHVGCENAGGEAAFLFFRLRADSEGSASGVAAYAVSPSGEATSLAELEQHEEVIEIPRGESVWPSVVALFERFTPEAIAINRGGSPISDGLSSTQYERMQAGLGNWMARTTSAETLISEWLSVKTPAEVQIMREAAALTAQWQVEAYGASVGGQTTDREIADMLEAKMAAAGVGDGWAPDQNPAVNSGRDRGHSHPTDRVIQPGDFIQTDFGIRVGDMWVTDIQRFAYVLAPGETEAPPEALARWDAAKRGRQAAFDAMRPGARGVDVDRAQRAEMNASGSLPVMWSTGHPVGYWAHDSGPSLGGGQEGRTPGGRQLSVLRPGMTFAFDGFHSWPLAGDHTKTISVEEMVVITEDGAEWLTPPQEDLILIHSPVARSSVPNPSGARGAW